MHLYYLKKKDRQYGSCSLTKVKIGVDLYKPYTIRDGVVYIIPGIHRIHQRKGFN